MKAATVSLELTEKELAYLQRAAGYPYLHGHPSLATKLGDASRDMREARRARNRALKAERNEKRLQKLQEAEYPCPHGCVTHTVPSEDPTACGHYHSPDEWGHHENLHNSAYWAAIGKEEE